LEQTSKKEIKRFYTQEGAERRRKHRELEIFFMHVFTMSCALIVHTKRNN